MLHKCANPACSCLFRSLSQGKLFLLETDSSATVKSSIALRGLRVRVVRQVDRYWLCDRCSSVLTLTFERGRGMVTVPLPARNTELPALPLIPPVTKGYRAELKGSL